MKGMNQDLRRIRLLLGLVAFGLFLSGVTIWPAYAELSWLSNASGGLPPLQAWILRCLTGLEETGKAYPFLLYAGDWLAFAHIMLAVLFLGAMRDPVRNRWIVEFGLISCLAIIPLALICGPLRGIPRFWQAVDCSFSLFAGLPLWLALRAIRRLEKQT